MHEASGAATALTLIVAGVLHVIGGEKDQHFSGLWLVFAGVSFLVYFFTGN